MPFISRDLLRISLAALRRDYSPLLIVSLPCMLAKKIPTCSTPAEATKTAIRFGSREEREWLDAYFRPGGGPPGLPYYMPATGEWVQELYPSRALQRRRKDFVGSIFFHPTQDTWALREGAAEVIKADVLKDKPAVPLIPLMAWMWRTRNVPSSLDEALAQFVREVGFERDGLIGPVYSVDIT